MDAVLHFPFWGAKPDGIWWFDGSPTLGSYYADNVPLSMIGGYTMSAYRHRADEFDTPDFFTRLAEHRPTPDHWETIKTTLPPQVLLGFLRRDDMKWNRGVDGTLTQVVSE